MVRATVLNKKDVNGKCLLNYVGFHEGAKYYFMPEVDPIYDEGGEYIGE